MTGTTTVIRKQKFVAYKLPNHPLDPQESFPRRKEKVLHSLAKDIADELAAYSIEDNSPIISRYEVNCVPNTFGEMIEVVCKFELTNPLTTLTVYVKYRKLGEYKGEDLYSEPLAVTTCKARFDLWKVMPDVLVTSFTVETPDLFNGDPPKPRPGTRYYRRGTADGSEGKPVSDCPYPEGGQRWADYIAGWKFEQKKRLAHVRGRDDHRAGVLLSQCPYEGNATLSGEWLKGWRESQLEAVRESLNLPLDIKEFHLPPNVPDISERQRSIWFML